ncbi:glycosyltransferase [Yoonia sediminilitoris]|uniref:Glycosyltransferase involved in cell wall biosynthesis n=1 Tax=Yoonia sediminilitoris TaxID=1286148 RepID=A0A2T6KB80_9RHOB|nr:glycosyltransferase [Yoonia sediminilitoris]PUB12129.1 glycosyltransferase involved in cell wall biosynthesis [Yoonia sediminilitoris]RCW92956.1 glycosyltransferase involved in cell wall biosynthesis [Yoonia sediminilitoris]
MKILHVAPSYFPATKWGGPIWSTKAICDGLDQTPGFVVRVLTTDAASPAPRDRVAPAELPYRVDYARRVAGHSIAPGLLARLPTAVAWADVVHLTATYNFPTLPTMAIARTLGKPLVWSPRGALQATASWEDAPRKGAKATFERLAQLLRPRDTVLHVTSDAEAAESVTRLPDIQTAMIPNCVAIPTLQLRAPRKGNGLRLLCLGRIHPKKGIDLLIDALAHLPGAVTLDIYGTGDADYVQALRSLAQPMGARIRFHGHVEREQKTAAFANADLFVLPSHSENFGIVVAEALAHAVPVLTTTATPWTGLQRMQCGRCMSLYDHDLRDEITQLAGQDLAAMGRCGRDWMRRGFSSSAMTAAFCALYQRLLVAPSALVTA